MISSSPNGEKRRNAPVHTRVSAVGRQTLAAMRNVGITLLRSWVVGNDAVDAHLFIRDSFIYLVYAAIIPSKVDFKLVFCAFTLPTKLSMAANCWL
jgi:hypothetical protein